MKKLFVLALVMLSFCGLAAAQTVTFDNPDVQFKFKKCFVSGSKAFIDFTITNETGTDFDALLIRNQDSGRLSFMTIVYDDEGNSYRWRDVSNGSNYIAGIEIGGTVMGSTDLTWCHLPNGVPVKMRITLSGFDEYAASLPLVKVSFRNMKTPEPYGMASMEARDLPVSR